MARNRIGLFIPFSERRTRPKKGGRTDERSIKLSVERAAEIRARYAAGGITQLALAREYGTSHQTIARVIAGTTWRADELG